MKLLFIFLTLLTYSFNLISQNIKVKLQNNLWQSSVNLIDRNTKPATLRLKTDTAPDIEIQFLKTNKLQLTFISKQTAFDPSGNELPQGTKSVSCNYNYLLKNDLMKIYTTITLAVTNKKYEDAYYYNILPLKYGDGFDFIPITKEQFK
jgi:hypothetical protein